jgi:hypothetical protein
LEFKRLFETKASHQQGNQVIFFDAAFFLPQTSAASRRASPLTGRNPDARRKMA